MIDSGIILALNVGSSTIKYHVFDADTLDVIGAEKCSTTDVDAILSTIFATYGTGFKAIVHRVVHGGPWFSGAVRLDDAVLHDLDALVPFAPLHQPYALTAIRTIQSMYPALAQYACFDTAFHHGHTADVDTYALPQELRDRGLKRYGFHGLSYDWVARQLAAHHPRLYAGRVVVAHLGNGASLCAMQNGRSIDTTMGLTTLDGVPMGTRCGAIDPGLVLYLLQDMGLSPAMVEDILYNQSGLRGLSGVSHDVKTLLESPDPRAAMALDVFCLRVAQAVGTLTVSLGGIDALVFTGGIGEHALPVREKILAHLAFMPALPHLVIPTNEEWVMAHAVQQELVGA